MFSTYAIAYEKIKLDRNFSNFSERALDITVRSILNKKVFYESFASIFVFTINLEISVFEVYLDALSTFEKKCCLV